MQLSDFDNLHTLATCAFCCITEGAGIYFQNVSEDVIKTWINFLEPCYRGVHKESKEVEPVGRNKVERDAMYTPDEKKKLKPDKDCRLMYAANNKDARKVVNYLSDLSGRILVPCDLTADSMLEAILHQISHKHDKYKVFELRKQICYFMVKYPEIFEPLCRKHFEENEESYESFVLNFFHGLAYPRLNVVTAVIAKMWNIRVSVVTPRGIYKMYHNSRQKSADLVIVWNGVSGDDSHYSGAKIDNPQWRPIKGLDWAGDVKILSNVKNAAALAEKMCRKRNAKKIFEEYNEVSETILNMKETLVNMNEEVNEYEKQLQSIKQKITVWAQNVYKMEGKQTVLRLRLLELGVDVDKFSEGGSIVPGFQEFTNLVEPPRKKAKTTPTATVSIPDDLGVPADFTDQTAQVTINAEVHKTDQPTPKAVTSTASTALTETPKAATSTASTAPPKAATSTTSTAPEEESEIEVTKVVQDDVTLLKEYPSADVIAERKQLWSNPDDTEDVDEAANPKPTQVVQATTRLFQSTPQLTAAQIQMVQSIQLPQQPSTFQTSHGEVSVRWGKTLKGVHKFWCFRCQRPFTTKNDCTRHEEENCPMLDKSEKKQYICEICKAVRSSKQYLREHIAEEHTKEYIYKCKGCGKGFFKHTALNHHKKSCLAILVPDTSGQN